MLDPLGYKIACDYSSDGMWITDGKGKTMYVNEACSQYHGINPEDFVGKHAKDLEQDGYLRPAVAPIAIAEKRRVTVTQRTRTGRAILITCTPVFDENNEVKYVVGNARDVTSLEDMREEYEKAQNMVKYYQIELDALKQSLNSQCEFICSSEAMVPVVKMATRAASSDANVLITGESGTGKDVLSRYIHRNSSRASGPFLKVSCPAIPAELLESELFGYKPGAFTGAQRQGKPGLFQLADKGTIFLDEIGDIPLAIQSKLLQVIEERQFIPVGDTKARFVDVRIISATNRDLLKLLNEGRFRSDLYYRLNVININIPPLRERTEEIEELVRHFCRKLNQKYNVRKSLSHSAIETLKRYQWPGNIRELEHLLEYLFIASQTQSISVNDLPEHIRNRSRIDRSIHADESSLQASDDESIEQMKALYDRLRSTYKVARVLGVSQSTVYRKIGDYVKAVNAQLPLL